ncbi:hypothetical protein [Methylobacterium nigriterrae]|uniref:hypothetical protein n=1 Tax=Methylobacterium nigriterrae TaxID=3127512 RepID=UPI003013C7DD
MLKPATLTVVPPSPPRPDPAGAHESARRALAEAIERHQEAQAELKANTDAQARAAELRLAAFMALDDAEAALEQAKEDLARRTTEAVLAGATELPSLDSYHAAKRNAEERYAALKVAEASLKDAAPPLQTTVRICASNLRERVRDVVLTAPAVAALLGPYRQIQADYHRARGLLNYLDDQDMLPAPFEGWRHPADGSAMADLGPWQDWLKALGSDASAAAPLPSSQNGGSRPG